MNFKTSIIIQNKKTTKISFMILNEKNKICFDVSTLIDSNILYGSIFFYEDLQESSKYLGYLDFGFSQTTQSKFIQRKLRNGELFLEEKFKLDLDFRKRLFLKMIGK